MENKHQTGRLSVSAVVRGILFPTSKTNTFPVRLPSGLLRQTKVAHPKFAEASEEKRKTPRFPRKVAPYPNLVPCSRAGSNQSAGISEIRGKNRDSSLLEQGS